MRWAPLIPLGIAAAISAGTYGRVPLPQLWGVTVWSVACFVAMLLSRSRPMRILLFNVGAVLLIAAVAEAYVRWTDESAESRHARLEMSHPEVLYIPDDTLGYRPAADSRTSARFSFDDRLIYDIAYTFDGEGLRVGLPAQTGDDDSCVLFFGCSYTFGAGVNDDQTMPYLVGLEAKGRYRVRNFGYSGYGPHQMLAAIESGLVERAAHCVPQYAIYMALPHHVVRASGRWWNDRSGPRFTVQANGELMRDGSFADDRILDGLKGMLGGLSTAVQLLGNPPATESDVALFHRIVQRSRDLLQNRFPGIQFHVLYWDFGGPEVFTNDSEAAGIPVHRLSKLLPTDPAELERTYQIEHDGHPNPQAHALIAEYVVTAILEQNRPRQGRAEMGSAP